MLQAWAVGHRRTSTCGSCEETILLTEGTGI